MQIPYKLFLAVRHRALIAGGIILFISLLAVGHAQASSTDDASDGRLMTVHDRGQERVVLTQRATVGEALEDAGISVAANDIVEPKQDSKLIAASYTVNIYRARPVIVVDGAIRQKIMTAAQTPEGIVEATNGELQDEDIVNVTANPNIVADGAGVVLTIDRATEFTLKLYGKPMNAYTQAATVGDMIKKKGITLAPSDTVSRSIGSPIEAGMTVEIWREGVQTVTVEEAVDFPIRTVLDTDKPIGTKEIKTPGTKGKKSVVYEITATSGKEVGRKAIQSVVTEQPKEQVVTMGANIGNGLTKSKGAGVFKDSKGVSHRETYYDLPMNVVMGACGGGGYTIRFDGAKVDKDGYVIIAAHLGNYPRCSVVETSIGPGKVYDTGGFTAKHPHGFDLATDWTNGDGR